MINLETKKKFEKVLKGWEKGTITEQEAFSFFDFARLKIDVMLDIVHRQNLINFHKKENHETSR